MSDDGRTEEPGQAGLVVLTLADLHEFHQVPQVKHRSLLGGLPDQVGAALLPHAEPALPGHQPGPACLVERRRAEPEIRPPISFEGISVR